jgi:hypothetical protein
MTGEPERPGALAVMRGIAAAGQVLTLCAVRRAIPVRSRPCLPISRTGGPPPLR